MFNDGEFIKTQNNLGKIMSVADISNIGHGRKERRVVFFFAVSGAWGTQSANSSFEFVDSRSLFNLGFGTEARLGDSAAQIARASWVDANGDVTLGDTVNDAVPAQSANRLLRLDFASDVVADRAAPILRAGGRVFVMEAGQSDFSAEWIRKLHARNVPNVRSNVIVVQHSTFNERNTSGNARIYADDQAAGLNDWNYVSSGANNRYVRIADGNNSTNGTAGYNERITAFQNEALSGANPNRRARALWTEARQITDASNYEFGPIPGGGVDFSDTVEMMWIFDRAGTNDGVANAREFWDRFVVNEGPFVALRKRNASGFAIDGGNGGADRQNVFLGATNPNNLNQQWRKVNTGDGTFQLRKRKAQGFAIDGDNGGSRGQNVGLFNSGVTSQNLHWLIE